MAAVPVTLQNDCRETSERVFEKFEARKAREVRERDNEVSPMKERSGNHAYALSPVTQNFPFSIPHTPKGVPRRRFLVIACETAGRFKASKRDLRKKSTLCRECRVTIACNSPQWYRKGLANRERL